MPISISTQAFLHLEYICIYIDISKLLLVSFIYAEQMYVFIVNDRINLFPDFAAN